MRLPALTLALVAALAPSVQAQEAFTWVYHADFGFYPSESRLDLVATQEGAQPAGPDSDIPGGLIWGTCLTEFDSGEIALRFEAFAGAAQHGDTVPFTLSGSSGASFNTTGVIIDRGNDPVGGVEIFVVAGGPEMQMLANSDIVTYGVIGLNDFIMDFDLSTNRAYVGEFDAHCGALAAGGALQRGSTPIPGVAPLAGGQGPDFGPALTGHDWIRVSDIREDVFETTLRIDYGVPETDDVLIRGECVIGAQGPLVVFQVGADVEGFFENAPVSLRVRGNDGRQVDLNGSVFGTTQEVGVLGVEVVLDPTDPAWQVIAGGATVHFERVGGRGGFTLTGDGPNTLGPFLTDCDQIGDLRPEGGTTPGAPIGDQQGFVSCDRFGQVASADTGQPIVLTFTNESGVYRGLLWVGPDGIPVDQGGMNPGEALSFNTDPGHIWMATDGPGNCREMIQPSTGQTSYRLTVQ